ncbi:MAG: tripartite tricarboxylate transporter substrate binding protein [Hyphomicrobiaceae bacterium]|nr:tripartite tricarboxylate transporter substrate binding protein [Hyphomicrobiaceae bacterium]
MPYIRRSPLIVAALALSIVAPHRAGAQAYPNRPVTLVTTFAAGSPQDLVVRAISGLVAADFKQPVVVDNKPGAAGGVAMSATVTQKPDGYALNIINSPGLANLPLMHKLAFDPSRDFDYIMQMASFPIGIAVRAESPFKSCTDLVDHARTNPGRITYGTPGAGSMANLGMQRLQALAGITLTHIPHKGVMEIIPAVLGGHVSLMVTGTEWKPLVDSGQMRLLMMWTDKRLPSFASAPTARECGYPFDLDVSFGLVAPTGLETAVAARVHGAFKTALESPSVRALMEKYNILPAYMDGPAFKARIARISGDMKPVIEQLGLLAK